MFLGTLAPTTTAQGWTSPFLVTDSDTDELVDISAATIKVAIRNPRNGQIVLQGSNVGDTHVAITGLGAFQVTFSQAEFAQVVGCLDYDIGILCTINGQPSQLIRGVLPVLDGVIIP